VVTPDELPAGRGAIVTRVNGEERGRGDLAGLAHPWDELVAHAARNTRLRPGELLVVAAPPPAGPPGVRGRPGRLGGGRVGRAGSGSTGSACWRPASSDQPPRAVCSAAATRARSYASRNSSTTASTSSSPRIRLVTQPESGNTWCRSARPVSTSMAAIRRGN